MSGFIVISADITAAQKALAGTSKSLKSISKQVVGTVAKGTVKAVKAVIRATTKPKTGELLKAYRYKVYKDGTGATVYPKVISTNPGLLMAKVQGLSYGAHIEPKNKKFLMVHGSNFYAKPKAVRITARGFVQAGKAYAESGAYEAELQKVIQKELKKYWG